MNGKNLRIATIAEFGNEWERFTQQRIKNMMEQAGLENIQFSSEIPFWCAAGCRKKLTEPIV
jgi:hypothetical protein